jgi:glucuronoarabinoxylan endo-1,4-beta-xylanase
LNATANVPGTFTYSPAAGTKPEVGTQTLSVTFTPQDTTKYATTTAVRTLTVNKAEPPVRWDLPAAVLQGSAAWYYTKMADDRVNALFGTSLTDSLGLSILRLRIAPAEWNTTTQTADTTQWTAELANGAAAQARGALVFASPWTPPASMKIVNTDRTNPLYSGRLDPARYADYAKYLNSYIRYAATRNVNLYAVSLQNEPDWDPATYESCLWSPDEMRVWAAGHGAEAVAGTTAKLMAPEYVHGDAAGQECYYAGELGWQITFDGHEKISSRPSLRNS